MNRDSAAGARGGVSRQQILWETGMHWRTLQKILTHSEPPGYRQTQPRPQPKIGPYRERLQQIMTADRDLSRKQQHTAKRVWERLREAGYTGGYTPVKEAVHEFHQRGQEVFVPLVHRPGEAQVDFGEALVRLGGQTVARGGLIFRRLHDGFL
jgi:transposase